MEREEFLREKTHKEDGLETSRRVFYTLTDDENVTKLSLTVHRTIKLVSLLVKKMEQSGDITSADVDDLLFETLH